MALVYGWRAYLDRTCAGDEVLRREVESLLGAHAQAGQLMNAEATRVTLPLPPTEKAGERIGRWDRAAGASTPRFPAAL